MAWHIHVTPILIADFDKAADAELAGTPEGGEQTKAAVEAAKTLIASGLVGSAAVNMVAAGQEEDTARGGHPFVQVTVSQFDAVDAPQTVDEIQAAAAVEVPAAAPAPWPEAEAQQQAVDTKLKEDTLAVADGKATDTLADEPLADVVKPTPPTDAQYQADSNVEPTV